MLQSFVYTNRNIIEASSSGKKKYGALYGVCPLVNYQHPYMVMKTATSHLKTGRWTGGWYWFAFAFCILLQRISSNERAPLPRTMPSCLAHWRMMPQVSGGYTGRMRQSSCCLVFTRSSLQHSWNVRYADFFYAVKAPTKCVYRMHSPHCKRTSLMHSLQSSSRCQRTTSPATRCPWFR